MQNKWQWIITQTKVNGARLFTFSDELLHWRFLLIGGGGRSSSSSLNEVSPTPIALNPCTQDLVVANVASCKGSFI